MTSAPLSLETLVYDTVHVEARRDYRPDQADGGRADIDLRIGVAKLEEESGALWNLVLAIEVPAAEAKAVPPYVVKLHCWSLFRVAPGAPVEDAARRLVTVTGGSIVYSMAREYLALVTARGPWGSFFLPTVSLLKLAGEGERQKE